MNREHNTQDRVLRQQCLRRYLAIAAVALVAGYGLALGLPTAVAGHRVSSGARAVPDSSTAAQASPRILEGSAVLRAGIIMDGARRMLADQWSDNEGHAEEAWCVTEYWSAPFWRGRPAGRAAADTLYRVFTLIPAETRSAATHSVDVSCPPGQPVMHSHPVTDGAADCNPSGSDYARLHERGDPFGVIWCDRRAFRFYYPSDVAKQ